MVRSRYAFGDNPRVHQQVLRGTPPRCAPESARNNARLVPRGPGHSPPSVAGVCHVLGPNQVEVGHVACLGHGGGGPLCPGRTFGVTCDAVVNGPPLNTHCTTLEGPATVRISTQLGRLGADFIAEVPDTQKGLQIGYSQMHVSRLLAKVLSTLRSQALDHPDLAATG
jgi:hypothetical protein